MSEIDILVSEVGPRDGLQSIDAILPTEVKNRWIRAQAEAGFREIEVGSFVPPKVLPQMADTAEVVAGALEVPGLNVAVLVPNLRGAENAIASGAHKISIPFSVSETHSLKNVRREHSSGESSYSPVDDPLSDAFGVIVSGVSALTIPSPLLEFENSTEQRMLPV